DRRQGRSAPRLRQSAHRARDLPLEKLSARCHRAAPAVARRLQVCCLKVLARLPPITFTAHIHCFPISSGSVANFIQERAKLSLYVSYIEAIELSKASQRHESRFSIRVSVKKQMALP